MACEQLLKQVEAWGGDYEVLDFDRDFESTADAAVLIGVPIAYLAKTLVFRSPLGAIMIITTGDVKVVKAKFKNRFGFDLIMMRAKELLEYTGYIPGSVTPFGITNRKVEIFMDNSIKRFRDEYVYPSGGEANSAVKIKPDDLFAVVKCKGWVNICSEVTEG